VDPQIVFILVGGVWADRLPRNLVMIAANVLSGAAQAAVAVLLLAGVAQLWQLIVPIVALSSREVRRLRRIDTIAVPAPEPETAPVPIR
jgi:hypothetical protein